VLGTGSRLVSIDRTAGESERGSSVIAVGRGLARDASCGMCGAAIISFGRFQAARHTMAPAAGLQKS